MTPHDDDPPSISPPPPPPPPLLDQSEQKKASRTGFSGSKFMTDKILATSKVRHFPHAKPLLRRS